MNQYAYGLGEPVNSADRWGLRTTTCDDPPCNPVFIWGGEATSGGGDGDHGCLLCAIIFGVVKGVDLIFGGGGGSTAGDNTGADPAPATGTPTGDPTPPVVEPPPPPSPPPGPPGGGGGGNTGRQGSVGAPGTLEYMIPVWGSGRAAIDDFQNDEWGAGCFNTVMACSDVFLVKSVLTGAGKGLWKVGGSHSWKATSRWLTRRGWREYRGQHAHHWFFERQGRIGSFVPESIKNQPWNLHLLDRRTHMRLHGLDPNAMVFAERLWFGTPHWSKALVISSGGRPVGMIFDDEQ